MFLDIGEDICVCHSCGYEFYHMWTAKDKNVIAVERFPIICPECKQKTAYRIEDDDASEM